MRTSLPTGTLAATDFRRGLRDFAEACADSAEAFAEACRDASIDGVNFLRRNRWWLLPELAVLTLVGAGFVYANAGGLDDELSVRAQAVLEQQSPADLELISIQHGHNPAEPARVLCAAEAFGSEPSNAENVDQVRVIYARYLCALVQKGTPWDYATRSSGPAVITLTDPPTVQLVRSGEGYSDRVRAMMPDDLEAEALEGFDDRGRPSGLLARYRAAVS